MAGGFPFYDLSRNVLFLETNKLSPCREKSSKSERCNFVHLLGEFREKELAFESRDPKMAMIRLKHLFERPIVAKTIGLIIAARRPRAACTRPRPSSSTPRHTRCSACWKSFPPSWRSPAGRALPWCTDSSLQSEPLAGTRSWPPEISAASSSRLFAGAERSERSSGRDKASSWLPVPEPPRSSMRCRIRRARDRRLASRMPAPRAPRGHAPATLRARSARGRPRR